MKKDKEWLKRIITDIQTMPSVATIEYNAGMQDAFGYVQKLIDELDEPEKVVIPKIVADWWERDGDLVTMYGGLRREKKHKFDLISKFDDMGLGDHLSKVEEWIDENDSTFLDLVNGKPYEVEKEKLYYIKFSENQYAQRFDESKIDSILVNDKLIAGRFTEEQIKKMNPKLMAFAVEVAE